MFKDNINFYPTPEWLARKMLSKVQGQPQRVLEPSAGKGDLVEAIKQKYTDFRGYGCPDISTMEINPELQACLRGKGIKLVDTDFLAFTGPDKYDLIIANPPFDNGDQHLLKALDIMYRGQIVFLLNAETIRNPYTNTRKLLVRRLDELGASIEFIPNAFADAERQTYVEVALIYVKIDRKVEDDLFAGADDWAPDAREEFKEKYEVSTGRTVGELVAEYNEIIQVGTDTIVNYYRNYRKVGRFLKLNDHDNKMRTYEAKDLTALMQADLNGLLRSVRTSFWRQTLDLDEVRTRLTKKKQAEFEEGLKLHCNMDFTERNIYQFILNLIGGFEQTFTDALLDIFDMFTVRHAWNKDNAHEKNVHFFSGWATNKAFKVGKKVVIPVYGSYGGAFYDASWGRWSLNHAAGETLRDIDVVMNTLDGGGEYLSICRALEIAFRHGLTKNIDSTYFKITAHKKNTIHLTFKDDDILRRFNVVACRGKGWLPGDFGSRPYKELSFEEKQVVNSFEGQKSYDQNVNVPLFGNHAPSLLGLSCSLSEPDTQCDHQLAA